MTAHLHDALTVANVDRVEAAISALLELVQPDPVVGILALSQALVSAMVDLREADPVAADYAHRVLEGLLEPPEERRTRTTQ